MMKKTAAELRQNARLYGRYCSKLTLRAQDSGRAMATRLFVLMLNPAMRGPSFSWAKLEEMAVSMVGLQVWSNFTDREWKTFKALIIEDAERSARLTVQELLRESAVETWLPLG